MTDRLLELAALDAAGALAVDGQLELHGLLAHATPSDLAAVAALYDVTVLLPAGSALEEPGEGVRARILRHASQNA